VRKDREAGLLGRKSLVEVKYRISSLNLKADFLKEDIWHLAVYNNNNNNNNNNNTNTDGMDMFNEWNRGDCHKKL
jgi:hypothetical protein